MSNTGIYYIFYFPYDAGEPNEIYTSYDLMIIWTCGENWVNNLRINGTC